jgi:hypothetical protein
MVMQLYTISAGLVARTSPNPTVHSVDSAQYREVTYTWALEECSMPGGVQGRGAGGQTNMR